jgi:predicted nucleic acid-binding protein
MTVYLLETDWAIQALAGYGRAMAILRRPPHSAAVSIVTIGELYEGAYGYSNPTLHIERLRSFLAAYGVIGITQDIIERFAEIRAGLRRRGEIIPDFDIIIGATALTRDLTVLTFNRRHFGRIPGIRLYEPV